MQELALTLPAGKRFYFASDFHLGTPTPQASLEREQRIVRWMDAARADAAAVFLLGDIFDFWFEYRKVVPRGFTRLLGRIADFTDNGIPVYIFTGNHDLWIFDYLPTEVGVQVFRDPVVLKTGAQRLLIGHGDGLGPGDNTYKLLKKVFVSPVAHWLFARLHPNFSIALAQAWSRQSRISNMKAGEHFQGPEREYLLTWCKEQEAAQHHDYYIFGHRHLPLDLEVSPVSRYVNLGEWVHFSTYAVYDGTKVELCTFEKPA
ncbi:MAG: UDP-2,3-diacylglucosamine diphosphatase [Cyclobacteriaceae bacterium]|nr:UDP-2,3-diacylglucosamine diphosphatase [Cyclobacteriaceae bacterium]